MHGSAGIDTVSNNDDVFTAGPDHHAVGKAHDGAAPPTLVELLEERSGCLTEWIQLKKREDSFVFRYVFNLSKIFL